MCGWAAGGSGTEMPHGRAMCAYTYAQAVSGLYRHRGASWGDVIVRYDNQTLQLGTLAPHTHTHIYTHARIYTHTHAHTHIHTYTHAHTYTHTHTHIHTPAGLGIILLP